MSYRFRLYAPIDSRVPLIRLENMAGQTFASVTPQGDGQYCYDGELTGPFWVYPQFAAGYDGSIVSGYIVNRDGLSFTAEPQDAVKGNLLVDYSIYGTGSDLQVRLVLLTQETYYATLAFDANGGTGAPAAIAGSMANTNPYVRFTIPADVPTRSGYAFAGWNQQADGSGARTYAPGEYFDGWGQTTSPGPTHWLYAQWTEAGSGVTAMIYNGGWGEYIPMIYDNGWREYTTEFPGG
nr:MAG TPA: hypothetical protein [Caudoviricetes sp.]